MIETLSSTARIAGSGVIAGAAGILTRPCCLGPAIFSLTGGSAAGLAQVFASHHTALGVISGFLLTVSVWMNIRWQAQLWNKWLAVISTIGAFAFMARGYWR
jgi:high-affinity Fe2+/Pb2+ permease